LEQQRDFFPTGVVEAVMNLESATFVTGEILHAAIAW
jgi:hypothetical protein